MNDFDPTNDMAERVRSLWRMKRLATSLLLVATAIFLAARTQEDTHSWVGYIRATAEAAMIGAIADWFAVTALFRHPLGLPIPHTAIIPSRKDEIGRGLGAFVQENFLTRAVVEERLGNLNLSARLGLWLAQPANAARVGDQAGGIIRATLDTLRDDQIQAALESAVAQRLRSIESGPILARGINLAVADGRHQELLSVLLRKVAEGLDENQDLLRSRLQRETPWWVPERFDDRIFDRVQLGVRRFLNEVADEPGHELRSSFDTRIAALTNDLVNSVEMRCRADELKAELIDHPALRDWSATVWADLKQSLLTHVDDPQSDLRQRIVEAASGFGERLSQDETLQARVNSWITATAAEAVERSKGEIGDVIATTVARWDSREATARIELQVGRDLQFIRINGTVVGGLAGLIIHTIGALV